MKKLIILLSFVIILSSCRMNNFTYRTPRNDVGIGASNYSNTISKSLNIQPVVSISYFNTYFDISNNLKFGKGSEYSMVSNVNKKLNKTNLGAVNIGYNIRLNNNKKFIIPTLGYVWAIKIYTDSNYPNGYYREISQTRFNIGVNYKIFLNKKIGLMVGIGTTERLKFNIIFKY